MGSAWDRYGLSSHEVNSLVGESVIQGHYCKRAWGVQVSARGSGIIQQGVCSSLGLRLGLGVGLGSLRK